ncbi:MAG: type II secretion system GspH family protein [Muribaculaceae bacterium]|nr:type II secretion system GspH family protein [Roseburia sp.]MCM1430501.1 type II secretion system GspH family protein [Muribaculaceae bacterium]MCM1493174.1 type II secretion system GspH family protein [Muribaculaceae bacterium]
MTGKRENNKGFSLVELIVVITIMAVLMVVLAPAMLRYVEKTRVQKDESAVSEVVRTIELALTDDKLYTEAGGDTITVTVADNTNIAVACAGGHSAPAAAGNLETDIRATVGDKIAFSSQQYRGKTFTIVFEYSSTRGAYIVRPNASDPDLNWTVS